MNLDEISGSGVQIPPRKCSPVFRLQREKNIIQNQNDDSVEFNSDDTYISKENFSDDDENFLTILQLSLPKSQEKTKIKTPDIKRNVGKFITSIEMKASLGIAFQILLIFLCYIQSDHQKSRVKCYKFDEQCKTSKAISDLIGSSLKFSRRPEPSKEFILEKHFNERYGINNEDFIQLKAQFYRRPDVPQPERYIMMS